MHALRKAVAGLCSCLVSASENWEVSVGRAQIIFPPPAPAELLALHPVNVLRRLTQGAFPRTDKARLPDVFTWAPATGSSQAHSAGSAGWPPSPQHHSPACQGVTVSPLLCALLTAALRPARGTPPPSLAGAPSYRDARLQLNSARLCCKFVQNAAAVRPVRRLACML